MSNSTYAPKLIADFIIDFDTYFSKFNITFLNFGLSANI